MGPTQDSLPPGGAAAGTGHKAAHIIVSGLVQGVGFRYFARASALRTGVVGWVRNASDGTVEAYAEGTEDRLKQFIQALHRGPTYSQVSDVAVTWQAPSGHYRSFHIRD